MPKKHQPKSFTTINSDHVAVGWHRVCDSDVTLYVAGSILGIDNLQLLTLLQSIKPESGNIQKLANTFKGHFGILYRDNTKVIAITDCVASFPIFCKQHHDGYILSTSGKSLVIDEEVDDSQVIALSFSGYTIGEHTLFRNVSILGHGKVFLHSKDGASIISNYYEYSPWNSDRKSPVSTLKAELSELTLNMILRVIEQAGPNHIAVPLSAGVDSRLRSA